MFVAIRKRIGQKALGRLAGPVPVATRQPAAGQEQFAGNSNRHLVHLAVEHVGAGIGNRNSNPEPFSRFRHWRHRRVGRVFRGAVQVIEAFDMVVGVNPRDKFARKRFSRQANGFHALGQGAKFEQFGHRCRNGVHQRHVA